MKKILAMAMGLAVIAGAAYAQTQTYSENAVGFISIDVTADDVAAGKMYALSIPFWNMDTATDEAHPGQWEFDKHPIATEAERNSMVYFWDAEKQEWKPAQRRASGFSSKRWVAPGELFFFKPAGPMTIVMNGEVPDETGLDVAVTPKGGLTAMGNPYPVEFEFDKSDLATKATRNSMVYFWKTADDGTQSWAPAQRRASGFSSKETVEPGVGFFFKSVEADQEGAENMTWKVKKPYNYPGKNMSEEE